MSRAAATLIKGPWKQEEDDQLRALIQLHGPRNWSLISHAIRGRSGKSCRLRWVNQLNPEVKKEPFSPEEDAKILQAHKEHGNKWAVIARLLQGRRVRGGAALPHTARLTPASDRLVAALPSTDNAIKNHWNSTLKRRGGPDGAAGGSEEGEGSPAGAAPKSTPRAKRAPPAPRLPPPPPAPRARKRSRSRPSVADEAAGVLGALAGAPLPGRPLPLADRASVACLPAFFGAAADDEFALKPQQARAPAPAPAQPRAPQPPPASPRPSRLASAGKAGRGACAPSPSPSPRTGRGASERELTTVLAGEPGHDPTASFAFLRPGDVEMDSFGDEVLPAGLCALDALAGWA